MFRRLYSEPIETIVWRAQMKNVGNLDRVLRLVVGLFLISLVFVGPQTPFGWIGLVLVITSVISFCPIYRLSGKSTCSTKP